MAMLQSTFEIRFGYGVAPDGPASLAPAQSLRRLGEPDPLDERFARPALVQRIELVEALAQARRDARNDRHGAQERVRALQERGQAWTGGDMRAFMARAALSPNGFRERLVAFWSDHFTVSGRNAELMLAVGSFVDEVIRPNLAGSFSALLRAAATHPAMLFYLDQNSSVGPNSPIGQRRGAGLNENLAREILELHTLGVSAAYTQQDVRQFAELLTGLGIDAKGFRFFPRAAEPGAETILGKTYGGDPPLLQDIFDFLDDLSLRADTARHIAQKLCVHFISQTPPAELIEQMTDAYLATGGQLQAVYEAMLSHPASARPVGDKVKWPFEYVVSCIRALGLGERLAGASLEELRQTHVAMQAMGQDLFRPPGPDGWPENGADWITPPTLAARIRWAAALAQEYGQDTDPEALARSVLGPGASPELLHAAREAESKWEGVALVLVSPRFNRR